jgi:hypothetical protein
MAYGQTQRGNMNSSVVFLIGNQFKEFESSSCLTCEQFFNLPAAKLACIQYLVLAQGLGTSVLSQLDSFLRRTGLLDVIQVEEYLSQKVGPGVVHKRLEKNVMVTVPKQINETLYEANLVVDDSCAELSDHISGVHMQGALFIEAGRQMFYACLPQICRQAGVFQEDMTFILKDVQVSFKKFLYPLPIKILVELSESRELKRLGMYVTEIHVRFEQGGIGVELTCKGVGHNKQKSKEHESSGATQMLDELLTRTLARPSRVLEMSA